LIVVAAEEDGKGIGRIRMRRIPDASAGPEAFSIRRLGRRSMFWRGH
jgi:hypothetical protein